MGRERLIRNVEPLGFEYCYLGNSSSCGKFRLRYVKLIGLDFAMIDDMNIHQVGISNQQMCNRIAFDDASYVMQSNRPRISDNLLPARFLTTATFSATLQREEHKLSLRQHKAFKKGNQNPVYGPNRIMGQESYWLRHRSRVLIFDS
jgi:hypothetical protein